MASSVSRIFMTFLSAVKKIFAYHFSPLPDDSGYLWIYCNKSGISPLLFEIICMFVKNFSLQMQKQAYTTGKESLWMSL